MEDQDQASFWLGDEGTEPAFAVNEASIYFEDNELIVAYGDGNIIGITMDSEEDRTVIRQVLGDANMWTAFLGALSQAMEQVKKEMSNN